MEESSSAHEDRLTQPILGKKAALSKAPQPTIYVSQLGTNPKSASVDLLHRFGVAGKHAQLPRLEDPYGILGPTAKYPNPNPAGNIKSEKKRVRPLGRTDTGNADSSSYGSGGSGNKVQATRSEVLPHTSRSMAMASIQNILGPSNTNLSAKGQATKTGMIQELTKFHLPSKGFASGVGSTSTTS